MNHINRRFRSLVTNGLVLDAADEIERLLEVLNYVADMTYCGGDGEWHFKLGYDPQRVLDALG